MHVPLRVMSFRMLKYATAVVAAFLPGVTAYGQSDVLALSSGSTSPGGTVSLNLSLTSPSGYQPAGLQWTLTYPPSNITNITAADGTAATAANKAIFCAGGAGSYTCLLTGLNPDIVQNGVVAVLTMTMSANATNSTIGVANVVSTSTTGLSIPATATGGTITTGGPLSLTQLSCSPNSLGSLASAACTVTLSGAAPLGGVNIVLGDNSAALSVPPFVTVPAGNSSANFTASTGVIGANQTATVTATLNGLSQNFSISLVASAALSSLVCNPGSIASGNSSSCTVGLNQAAPAGGASVSLSSNNGALSVPGSVSVPAGSSSAAFTAGAGTILTSQTATVTATLNSASQTATLNLMAPTLVSAIACNPSSLVSGGFSTCTITLNQAAPSGGVAVALSSNNAALTVPASVNASAGAGTVAFTASAGAIAANQTAVVTATLNGASQSASISLTASVVLSAVACNPTTLASGASSACTVTLSQPAPAGGTTVSLSSNNTNLSVPASVNVSAGASTGNFTATAGSIPTSQTAAITAAWNGATQTVSISLAPSVLLSSLICSPTALLSESPATCTATLNQAAPAGGVTLALSTSSAFLATPASVAVAAGSSSVTFTATAGTIAAQWQRATLTASLNGASEQVSFILASKLTISAFGCTPSSLSSGGSGSCALTLGRNTAQLAGLTITLAVSNPLLTVPASVVVPTWSKTATFTVTAGSIPSNQTAIITATVSDISQTASVSLVAGAPALTTLYSFGANNDGANPQARVVIGQNGVLYGATQGGGGTLFELAPPAAAGEPWTEQTLLAFGADNVSASSRPVGDLLYCNGVLFGTTYDGGTSLRGSAVAIIPSSGGAWTVADLHDFVGGAQPADGSGPRAGLVLSAQGTLYGTTRQGGLYSLTGATGPNSAGSGTVFYLKPPPGGNGAWSEGLLYNFSGGSDGGDPEAPVVIDAHGNLYGVAYNGGAGYGTVFELSPPAANGAGWTFNLIHTFYETDGANPRAGLILDASGALYGTTVNGGTAGMGTVFQLTPPAATGGEWTETVLYNFTGQNGDGANPQAGLVFGMSGRLYGVTPSGGSNSCLPAGCGTLFELIPPAAPGGAWTGAVLHVFTGQNGDGANPQAGLVMDNHGALYGTTLNGGTAGKGTVFKLTP